MKVLKILSICLLASFLQNCGPDLTQPWGKGKDIDAPEVEDKKSGLRVAANPYQKPSDESNASFGLAVIYDRNSKQGVREVKFPVDDSGYLENRYFVSNPQESEKAYSDDNRFIYTHDDPEFHEVSVFANINLIREWYRDHQIEPMTEQAVVRSGGSINGNVNNAMYSPKSGSKDTEFVIAKGDGYILKNLTLDADVIAHEFAHHVIFQKVKGTSGDSLILHEGLADFFTVMRNDDPCLGRSICPSQSFICEIRTQCLRSAQNYYSLRNRQDKDLAHTTQAISGLFWDLYQDFGVPKDTLVKLVIRSLEYLNNSPTLEDFSRALLKVDLEYFDGSYQQSLKSVFDERGLAHN